MPLSAKIPNVKFNLKDNPKDHRDPRRNVPSLVYALFRYKHGRLKYSTGEKVIPKYWHSLKGQAKNVKNHPGYLEINQRLESLAKSIRAIYKNNGFGDISLKEFKHKLDLINGKIKDEDISSKPKTLFEFIEIYLKQRKENPTISRGTWKVQQTCYNHLKNYSKKLSRDLDFLDIDWSFRRDFENWCYNANNHSINYAGKMIAELTHFLRAAKREGLFNSEIIDDTQWHVKLKKTSKKFALSFDELTKLYEYDFSSNERLERVRDLFIIGAYSGLRHSDFNRIKPKHFIKEDGIEMIEINTDKTDELVTIPLFPELKEMILKYDYNPPKISNQKFNDYLKECCEVVGIDKTLNFSTYNGGIKEDHSKPFYEIIASHTARRSFATNFYKLGIPAILLMKITSHKSERQFLNYICIDGRENAKEVAKKVATITEKARLREIQ